MRLFYRLTKPVEEKIQVTTAENLSSTEATQTPLAALNRLETTKLDQTIDRPSNKSDSQTDNQDDKENKCKNLVDTSINENCNIF